MGKRGKINSNYDVRSSNSKKMWLDPSYRENLISKRREIAAEKRLNFPFKRCHQCGNNFQVFPSRFERQKFCTKKCKIEASKGKPNLKNRGNKSSLRSGSGIKGTYKNWVFRSTYELSFMMNVIEKQCLDVAYEPFKVLLSSGKYYIPDFVSIADKIIYEIKHKKALQFESVKRKMMFVNEWCKDNAYDLKIYTQDDMDIISYEDLAKLVISGDVSLFERKNAGSRYDSVVKKVVKIHG